MIPTPQILRVTMMSQLMIIRNNLWELNVSLGRLLFQGFGMNLLQRIFNSIVTMEGKLLLKLVKITRCEDHHQYTEEFGKENGENMQQKFETLLEGNDYGLVLIILQKRLPELMRKKKLEFEETLYLEKNKNLNSYVASPVTGAVCLPSASEETNVLYSHPSPSSVLDISTTSIVNGLAFAIKEEENAIKIAEEEPPIPGFLEDHLIPPSLCQEFNLCFEDNFPFANDLEQQSILGFLDDPLASPSIGQELNLGFEENSLYGNDLGQFFEGLDHVDMDNTMCEFENWEANVLPGYEFELGKDELAWIDEAIVGP
uniref:Uncharacterized protein n=1 Tax=Davidia involucrata TaxID=16924 RepID=A0A5B7A164_DAVIN